MSSSATQTPHYMHYMMARVLEVPMADIRVIKINYIDVTVAATILEEMFNEGAKGKAQPPKRQPKEKAKPAPPRPVHRSAA